MNTPFADLLASPATHFRLSFYAAVAWLVASAAERFRDRGSIAERFPFLEGYQRDLSRREIARLDAGEAADWWQDAVRRWEASYAGFLPIRAIRTAAGFDDQPMLLLFAVGLVDEDARFGLLFEALDCVQSRRPTIGVLTELWSARGEGSDGTCARGPAPGARAAAGGQPGGASGGVDPSGPGPGLGRLTR